jgi:putative FmdB family regulatory protein
MFYDYKCEECGLVEEKMHGMMEEIEYPCPLCGKVMKKLMSTNVSVHYKGNGWPRKGSGLFGNPTKTTEVGVKVNSAYKDAVNPEITKR